MIIEKKFFKETIVIENDGKSVWAYLTETETGKPVKDVFICSPIEPEDTLDKAYIEAGNPPKLCKQYASGKAYIPNVDISNTNVLLAGRSGNYSIFLNGVPIAALYQNYERGFSKSVSVESGFGMPWDQELYLKVFP